MSKFRRSRNDIDRTGLAGVGTLHGSHGLLQQISRYFVKVELRRARRRTYCRFFSGFVVFFGVFFEYF